MMFQVDMNISQPSDPLPSASVITGSNSEPACCSVEVVSPGFEPRSAGPEPTMMDRYTKRLASGPKASHSSSKR